MIRAMEGSVDVTTVDVSLEMLNIEDDPIFLLLEINKYDSSR